MLFNSPEYLLFLPLVFILYWFVFPKNHRHQNLLILVASYVFYGWWSWEFTGLLLLSTLLDYSYGFGVAATDRRKSKVFLGLSVITNLGILGFFKYYNFFAIQVQEGLELLGLHAHPVLLEIVLPIGISFYTFHGMSYVFDIYRGKQKPVKNLVDYGVFVSFFPLLVAGPIERATHLLPQIQKSRSFRYIQAVEGARMIVWGMFKKVVIADSLAPMVDAVFENPADHSGTTLILGAIAFSIQIYGDFSGYSDIAIGTAKLLGFELLSNFKFPYFSRDLAEFWRRWHISLSSWFRDYLYIPLGGSREGKLKSVRNTFLIFLVSGFWHGANWTFLAWGFLHALGFLPLLLAGKNRSHVQEIVAANKALPRPKEFFQMLITFSFVCFAWIFFRAETMDAAMNYIVQIGKSIVHNPEQFLRTPEYVHVLLYILPLLCADWYLRKDERALRVPQNPWVRFALYLALLQMIFTKFHTETSFIYFQF